MAAIQKRGKNKEQQYDFIQQSDIVAEVRAKLREYKVMMETHWLSYTVSEGKNARGNPFWHYVGMFKFALVAHDTGERIEFDNWPGEAIEYSDKGLNKASTSGQKFFLIRTFLISDADPDESSPGAEPPREGAKRGKALAGSPKPPALVDRPLVGSWKEFVLTLKSKSLNGKKLGDLKDADLRILKESWVDKIDWNDEGVVTPRLKLQKAAIAMALAERGIEETRTPLERLLWEMDNHKMSESEWLTCAAAQGYMEGETVESITPKEAQAILDDLPKFLSLCDTLS